ncbi:prolipoprotein diacylglyceryl transferase [uncultured Bacteroides sp.]|uniref:prolipoprotein diacylglyceryl transferase n=1 Tax=uncultured Bacteroides sp. TaxID=162156 RepID=UPI002611DBB5|nr:prolipoprotein diacylglyceryl transferase [uncultured Bacteroides sp.]
MLYINWDIDPVIFSIGQVKLQYYGLIFVTGLALCYYIIGSIYKKENIYTSNAMEKLFVFAIIGIFGGARLGHCLFYDFEYFSSHIIEIFIPFRENAEGVYEFIGYKGLASHGGTIGLFIAMLLYSRKVHIPFSKIIDIIAILAPLGGAFIRISNLMNSEIIGRPTNVPWAFIFKQVDDLPRHPSQLYESLSYFLIFLVVYLLYKYKRQLFKIGSYFYFGLSIFAIFFMRFVLEFTKENQKSFEDSLSFNMGQLLSIPFILVGAILVIKNVVNVCKKAD